MTDSGMSQDASDKGQQVGSARDVKQMKVGDLIDVAVQNNMDVEALNNLIGDIQAALDVEAGNVDNDDDG